MNTFKKAALILAFAGLSLPALAKPIDPTKPDNLINLNKASKEELMKGLEGLTENQADAIIQYRKMEGAFIKVPELLHIGIGPEIIGPNYNKLTVGGATFADKKKDRF